MKLPRASVRRAVRDVEDAELGDARLTKRLKMVVERLATRPSESFPDLMGSEAELEGAYRFVNNPRVHVKALLAPHSRATARRARKVPTVLAIHDTTPCQVRHGVPEEVGFLPTGKAGFMVHYTLVVNAPEREALGVVNVEPIFRMKRPRKSAHHGKKKKKIGGAATTQKKTRESDRWFRGIEQAERTLSGCNVLHLADRESDSYELLYACSSQGLRFVIRVRVPNRKARQDGTLGNVRMFAEAAKGVLTREVGLSLRKGSTAPSATHKARLARLARLSFAATEVEIVRPHYYPAGSLPESLRINVVRVYETQPPPGEVPIEWLLYTSEPIDTARKIAAVVDAYRARWMIEECNKALKTGCLIDQREFESRHALLNLIATSLPIACQILSLRFRAGEKPDRPGTDVLSPLQIRILRKFGPRALPMNPTAEEVVFALAGLGGHVRSNGPPGWIILRRAMTRLLDLEAGWRGRRLEM